MFCCFVYFSLWSYHYYYIAIISIRVRVVFLVFVLFFDCVLYVCMHVGLCMHVCTVCVYVGAGKGYMDIKCSVCSSLYIPIPNKRMIKMIKKKNKNLMLSFYPPHPLVPGIMCRTIVLSVWGVIIVCNLSVMEHRSADFPLSSFHTN